MSVAFVTSVALASAVSAQQAGEWEPKPEAEAEATCVALAQWLDVAKPASDPRALLLAYRDHLLRSGESESDVDATMPHVWRCAFRDRATLRLLWNRVYAGDAPIFRDAPNRLVIEMAAQRAPGAALDYGMGQGRNAIYLALEGWRVTGFDPSDEGVRIAREAAEAAGVTIETAVATDDEFDFGADRWDLVVVTYVKTLDAKDVTRIERALAPGGILVYENGATEDNTWLESFSSFDVLRFDEVEDYPDWNPAEKMRLHRLVAQKR